MKNRKERESFIKNPASYELAEETTFTRTSKLRYKGETWFRIEHFEDAIRYDPDFKKIVHEARWIDHGIYELKEGTECLIPISRTTLIEKITELDRKYPDRASAPAHPHTIIIKRERNENRKRV